jgi:hypothetical protein
MGLAQIFVGGQGAHPSISCKKDVLEAVILCSDAIFKKMVAVCHALGRMNRFGFGFGTQQTKWTDS